MTNIAVFGCKTTTLFILRTLPSNITITHLITIPPDLGTRHNVADYTDLCECCHERGITVYQANKYSLQDERDIAAIREMDLTLGFAIGWQRLIPAQVLASIRGGVYGMHGSSMNLPYGRGRSPMNWSLIEDRRFFYTNLFKYDDGVDSGAIVDTFLFNITPSDTAETMHYKNMLAMRYLIGKHSDDLLNGRCQCHNQPPHEPTYYPRRAPTDSLIDWERDIFFLDRFVRAVTRPFNGAYTWLDGLRVVVFRASIFDTDVVDYGYQHYPTATVLEVLPNGKFLVKALGGILIVHDYETDATLCAGARFSNHTDQVHYFALNQFGFYDHPKS